MLTHSAKQLMKAIQLLRNSGYSVRAEEESLKARLESLEKELSKSAVFRGRLLEMTTQVRALRDNVSSSQQQQQGRAESYGGVNESSLHAVFEVGLLSMYSFARI